MSQFSAGDPVFFKHAEHSWILGKVTSATAKSVGCVSDDALRGQKDEIVPNVSPGDVEAIMGTDVDEDVEDLLQLTVLHDATLLRCLCLRYMKDHIYTNIGAIVVALNPFTFSIPWYQDGEMAKYLAEGERIERNLPHSWAQAHNTYHELVRDQSPQFILVSGESGSGKTEASKMVVKYFAALSKQRGSAEDGARSAECGVKLQQCSPILEAFGNAKTVRNDNSSRFGKFMKIQFEPTSFMLVGSHTTRYLLEKSRIVTASPGERIYHSFYLLHQSGPFVGEFSMAAQSEYRSINAGGTIVNGDFSTTDDFAEVVGAMRTIGLDDAQIRTVWAATTGVASLLNADFAEDTSGSGTVVAANSKRFVADAARLWAIDEATLDKELTTTALVIRGESSLKRHTITQANDARDALSKALYNELFGYLVDACNRMCDFGDTKDAWIGLLDIFGFEDFKVNSFEQLCINLANETLQGHYNSFVFEKDMEECRAEGIDTAKIVCPDNSPCIDMLSSPQGSVLALLDDECAIGSGNDVGFVENVVKKYDGISADFIRVKTSKLHFGVRHYAGDVRYDATGWVDKNRDTLKDAIKLMMRSSADPVVATLLPEPVERRGRAVTVGGFFRQQLQELMAVILGSNPHWIRCVKPHPAKKPKMFDGVQTMNQLESSGVLGTVKIRKAGYPVRMPFAMFAKRFAVLSGKGESAAYFKLAKAAEAVIAAKRPGGKPAPAAAESQCKEAAIAMLKEAAVKNPEQWQSGKTKIFMKPECVAAMEKLRTQRRNAALVSIQCAGRALFARKELARTKVVRAVNCIVDEFKAYAERTASTRAEMRAMRERQHVERRALSDSCTDDHGRLALSLAVEHEALLSNLLVSVEASQRDAIERTETTAFLLLSSSSGLVFLDSKEATARAKLEALLTEEHYFTFLDALEDLAGEYVGLERRGRRAIIEAEHAEFHRRVAAGPSATQLLECKEAAERFRVEAATGKDHNALAEHHWSRLRLWLERGPAAARPGSEAELRAVIVDEEAKERKLRKAFERKVIWRAAFASIAGDEVHDRGYLAEEYEPHFRRQLARAMRVEGAAIHVREASWQLVVLERNVRRGLWSIQQEAFAHFVGSAQEELLFQDMATTEADEATSRRRIETAERCYRQLLADELPPGSVMAALSEIFDDETYWRSQVAALEHRERTLRLGAGVVHLHLFKQENTFRRLVFLFSCVNRYEAHGRCAILADEFNRRRVIAGALNTDSVRDAVREARRASQVAEIEDTIWRQVEAAEMKRLHDAAASLAAAFPDDAEDIMTVVGAQPSTNERMQSSERQYTALRGQSFPKAYRPVWDTLKRPDDASPTRPQGSTYVDSVRHALRRSVDDVAAEVNTHRDPDQVL